jgi:choline dehydrogenase-like flavoprotein
MSVEEQRTIPAYADGKPGLLLERARVIGSCSSHNGCAAVWGRRVDYDGWAALGNPGWDTESLLPLLRSASDQLRVTKEDRRHAAPGDLLISAAGQDSAGWRVPIEWRGEWRARTRQHGQGGCVAADRGSGQ